MRQRRCEAGQHVKCCFWKQWWMWWGEGALLSGLEAVIERKSCPGSSCSEKTLTDCSLYKMKAIFRAKVSEIVPYSLFVPAMGWFVYRFWVYYLCSTIWMLLAQNITRTILQKVCSLNPIILIVWIRHIKKRFSGQTRRYSWWELRDHNFVCRFLRCWRTFFKKQSCLLEGVEIDGLHLEGPCSLNIPGLTSDSFWIHVLCISFLFLQSLLRKTECPSRVRKSTIRAGM